MQRLVIDLAKKVPLQPLFFKQGDVGRKFAMVLQDQGEPYQPPSGSIFTIWYSINGSEGNYSSIGDDRAVILQDNIAQVEVITQMVSNPGMGQLALILHDPHGYQLGLWNLFFEVEAIPGMGSSGAEQYYTALSEAAAQALSSAGEAAASAKRAKAAADRLIPDPTLSVRGLAADAAETGKAIRLQATRLDNLLGVSNENTEGNAELQDLRVAFNGAIYSSAGKAVRSQIEQVSEALTFWREVTSANRFDNNYEVEGYYLEGGKGNLMPTGAPKGDFYYCKVTSEFRELGELQDEYVYLSMSPYDSSVPVAIALYDENKNLLYLSTFGTGEFPQVITTRMMGATPKYFRVQTSTQYAGQVYVSGTPYDLDDDTSVVYGYSYRLIEKVDDSKIGRSLWSSKNLVDRLCPLLEKSGPHIQCIPLGGYPLTVISHIITTQPGSGDPSPDNVRPLVVNKNLSMSLSGKNLFDYDSQQVELGYVMANGKLSESQNYYRTTYIRCDHLRGRVITLSPTPGGNLPSMGFYTSDNTESRIPGAGGKGNNIQVPDDANYLRFSMDWATIENREVDKDGNVTKKEFKPDDEVRIQIELGPVATSYEPFQSQQLFSIELPDEIAMGTYNWGTGLLTVTHRVVELGSLEWEYDQDNSHFEGILTSESQNLAPGECHEEELLCSVYKPTRDAAGIDSGGYWEENVIAVSRDEVNLIDPRYESPEDLITYLQSVGAKLVYPLVNPYTLQYDPHQILALGGVNYLVSGTGETQVMGRADPKAEHQKLTERIAALEAAILNNI